MARRSDDMVLSQRKYTLDILADSGFQGCQPSSFLVEKISKLDDATDSPVVDAGQYQCLIGCPL